MNLFDVYTLWNIEPVYGRDTRVFDADGVEYLDLYGGHAVISVGHCHPKYVEAIKVQTERLGFYSNSVVNSMQQKLAERLGKISGYDDYTLFLCNSGAEANENAFKLASFHTARKKILAFDHAFHGRTSGAVAATDNPRIRSPFNMTDNVEFVSLDITPDKLQQLLETSQFAAVVIEGIQGVGGIQVPSDTLFKSLRDICDKTGTLLIVDEIQSGYGRTGDFFAHQHSGVSADIITVAKGIANGYPMAAVLISPTIKPVKGMLGTTFGGNHLGCAAALAVLDIIKDESLIDNARIVGKYLIDRLKKIDGVKDVRGRGLMIGFDTEHKASDLRNKLLYDYKIFTGGAGTHTVRLLPSLTLTQNDADIFIDALTQSLKSLSDK